MKKKNMQIKPFSYYFNSICNANEVVKQSDKSSIRIIFDFQKQYKGYDTRIE